MNNSTITLPLNNRCKRGSHTDHVLNINGHRYGVGGIPQGQEGRKVFEGPMVQGPWAYTFELCAAVCSNTKMNTGVESQRMQAEKTEHIVEIGGTLEFAGNTYKVKQGFNNDVNLELLG